ncbi:MAG: RDD family protein [Chitinophagaceae bacterium]|nr:RDD family protein [Chitinophagaceae bacterium]
MQESYPELRDRIQSSFIDLILIVALMYAFARILDNFQLVPDWVRIALFASLFLLYEPVSMMFGCTLGNFLKGIRVRKYADTSKKINFLQSLIRYPIKVLLGWISFLTINSDAKRRAIHDMIAGSVMIRKSA